MLLQQMRDGQVVPKLSEEQCMEVMLDVLSDPALHERAAAGYKLVGQSIDLHGAEDSLVAREAGDLWNERTTDNFPSMRAKIDTELTTVADEWASGGLTWCEKDVLRLIQPYPKNRKVDQIIATLGEDHYHDAVHCAHDNPVAGEDEESISSGSDDADGNDEPVEHDPAAVAAECVVSAGGAGLEGSHVESAPLSVGDADAVHNVRVTMAALQEHIEGLRAIGHVRGVQCLLAELAKERRKERGLVKDSPAVADAFLRVRRAADQDRLTNMHAVAKQKERQRQTAKTATDQQVAVAKLKETKRQIKDLEGIVACKHAVRTFTIDALGAGSGNAGGPKSRDNRFDVLDRLKNLGAGLSPGQKNDWKWFKEAWDKAMVAAHGGAWAGVFSTWVQGVLNDERSNAFSTFVYDETRRVFSGSAALHVPGA